MNVIGIDTSCDDTSAGVVSGDRRVLSNVVHSQVKLHRDPAAPEPRRDRTISNNFETHLLI